ncbi:unnamed protein product [Rotaria sordida]|uniref:Uncharacterized protein n=1 Tax=Rotaria sordida TaxID=392033 RepID=A0A815NXA6_9BILA|nr:unnamed protein product [Rotaria sordida]CAF1436207.1 unnamed protein product [Rotaria sordida]
MPKFFILSKQITLFLFIIVLELSIELSQAAPLNKRRTVDMDSPNDNEVYQQRRMYDLNKLRHFLLTSSEAQRAAKRTKQNLYKQQLVGEYFKLVNDENSDRLQEVKKRIKTFCTTYDDIINSDQAACG